MDIIRTLASELEIQDWQAEAAVKLIDDGNTIPFISRYRKEATGALNDEVLRKLFERLNYLRNLEEKKMQVLSTIEEQGKLTDELRAQIEAAQTLVVVEDLYRPYRPKRRTRATIAKEKGLDGLANLILLQQTARPIEEEAKAYVNEEKDVKTVADAIAGAQDILAEMISDEANYRSRIRNMTMKEGILSSSARDEKAQSVYEMYYTYAEPLNKVADHRVLAINRGEKEKFLTVKIEAPEDKILAYLEHQVIRKDNPSTAPVLKTAIADSYKRLIGPAIEREIRSAMMEKAEDGAISVFGKNLEQLLLQQNEAEAAWKKQQEVYDRYTEIYKTNLKVYEALMPKMNERSRIMEEHRRLDDLYNLLAGKVTGSRMDIETYVQRYYLERILYAANRRFLEMSVGQFELRMCDITKAGEGRNRGLDLMVYSNVTGKEREVRTLSGGESFMAALSLALGMADQIQQSSSAIHLDMMFIDEGFGSLDSHSRDQAVRVLQQMAGGSKLIGIISHVSELKQEIEDQLIVSKNEDGSSVRWQIS